ncbi:MAG TPA: DUF1569 domain-containing protein [Acidobacteriaceae bacterium]
MAKTLANKAECEEIRQRIAALTPGSRRIWGTMSIGGMLCHVEDSYKSVMGERPLSTSKLGIPQGMAKFLALRSPFRWPRGMMTGESVRQGGGGTLPTEFAEDRARLLETFDRFCGCTQLIPVHPMLGEMQRADWQRWGWLHADHHLRQFSA